MEPDLKDALARRRRQGGSGHKEKQEDGSSSSSKPRSTRRHKSSASDEGTVNSTGTLESSDSKLSHRSSKRPVGRSGSAASLASRETSSSKDSTGRSSRRKGERRGRKKNPSTNSVASSGSSSRRKKTGEDGDEEEDDKSHSRDLSHRQDNSDGDGEAEDPNHPVDFTAAFGDTDFAAAFPTTKTTNTPSNANTDAAGFAAFDNSAFADFGGETSGVGAGFATFESNPVDDSSSYQPPAFGLPQLKPLKSYDKSPLESTPKMPSQKFFRLIDPPVHSVSVKCTPPPVASPLNGNLIVVQNRPNGDKYLCEVNPLTGAQVASTPLMSSSLQKKIAQKYSVTVAAVESVLVTSIGIHTVQNNSRARIACLLDVLVLENSEVLRTICIYSIGYGGSTRPISLLAVLSPPSGNDFSYDPKSLLVADSCVFISGASSKGPCVFLCKHTVKETWSANFVGKDSSRITSMAVTTGTKRDDPYLAISLTDGSLSVWTYSAAMKMTTKTAESLRRLLFPLCRLEGAKILSRCAPTKYSSKDVDVRETSKEIGYCTRLEWTAPRPSLSSMLMLVAGFQGGVALYHVALPAIESKSDGKLEPVSAPTQTTQLSQTPNLKPFSLARWPAVHQSSSVSWLDLGPHAPPGISIVLSGLPGQPEYTRLLVCSANIPQYVSSTESAAMAPLQILGTREWKTLSPLSPKGLISCAALGGVSYYTDESVEAFKITNIGKRICSTPIGLMSSGAVYMPDNMVEQHGVLHVFTNWHCERLQVSGGLWEWSTPTRRHWLCETVPGDSKHSSCRDESKEQEGEVVLAGAVSKILCEMGGVDSLSTAVPDRIGRSGDFSAIALRELNSALCHSIAIVEASAGTRSRMVQIVEGRDFVFLPSAVEKTPCALLLENGGKITFCRRKPNKESKTLWQLENSYRPIIGVGSDEESYIDCRKIVLGRFQDTARLIAIGTRKRDGKNCILAGELEEVSVNDAETSWTKMLPNADNSPSFWLDDAEHVTILLQLPSDEQIEGAVAVATNKRVLILSSAMAVLGETRVSATPDALTPIGTRSVAFCSDDSKVRYLTGLESPHTLGLIASLPKVQNKYSSFLLLAVRQDRLIYSELHCGSCLVEKGEDRNTFELPISITRPALLLEPLIANAVSTHGKDLSSMSLLRTIIEKFGRKVSTMAHGEDEGIGNLGAGLTPKVFAILSNYNIREAASWLLTGALHFDRASNSRILPPWMPVSARSSAALDGDHKLHVLAHGDQYFSDYVKSPETNMTSTLPRPSDPSARYSQDYALESFRRGGTVDSLKLLDVTGSGSSDALLLQTALALQADPFQDTSEILGALCQGDNQLGKSSSSSANSSLASLALQLKSGRIVSNEDAQHDFSKQFMKHLAPSFQKGKRIGRERQRLLSENMFTKINQARSPSLVSKLFSTDLSEMKHVWNEGPNRQKENLLMLDDIKDWFGRRRPVVLGKEGAKSAEDRGASTLADILNKGDDDSFGADSEDDFKDGWVDGVGEGHKDEDKIAMYFRFSEGDEEEETDWKTDGFSDLSKFEGKAVLVGGSDGVILEESKSSVDEGEPGKVKALFDLVFSDRSVGQPGGLAIAAPRGGSLDVGMFHGPDHDSRQRSTIEFWFWVPQRIDSSVVLMRRTYGQSGGDLERACLAANEDSNLWEVVLQQNGEVEFRTSSGAKLTTEPTPAIDEESSPQSSVTFDRWNHICVTFKQASTTRSHVKLYLKGKEKLSDTLDFLPPGIELDDFAGASALDRVLEKSHLLFALDHPAGYRTTELRVWAMERAQEDIETFMTEYLECAEIKRKLRVAIKKKGGGAKGKAGGLLKPPGALAPPKTMLAPPGGHKQPDESGRSVPKKAGLLAPPKDAKDQEVPHEDPKSTPSVPSSFTTFNNDAAFAGFNPSPEKVQSTAAEALSDQNFEATQTSEFQTSPKISDTGLSEAPQDDEDFAVNNPEISPLWDSAIPLSEQVRSSAAAALIRGPPATRHFGGNRGGLPDYRELERFGVGAISICGSEKTIVWRDDQVPPGLTYPIGASGAVVSDQMDEDGSEFLCCFLAKDKRMVVFELSTRTVVVELQMTTKLNYWRFLPPEAGEDTLCFMLVTPVGGFHWMPLDESPRPRQVWKRGPELQGKKIVSYEEGGTNGLDGQNMLSKAGLLQVTNTSTGGRLEAWIVPICGDSQAVCASDDVLGACLCTPPEIGYEAWMPLLLFVVTADNDLRLCISAIAETSEVSVGLTDVMTDALIEMDDYAMLDYAPPTLAMGTWPEVLCCSLGSTIVVIHRRKGLVVAYELGESGLELIAQECVGHFVVDAVMRYSAVEGGAEIVLLMSDDKNPRDGRVGTFCFRSAV